MSRLILGWVIGKVLRSMHDANAASTPYDASKDPIHLEPVRANELVLQINLYETLEPGATTYISSDMTVLVPARRVRVVDVQLTDVRSADRVRQNQTGAAARRRFRIEDISLAAIRAEMPTSNDDWQVERVAQYRVVYGVEQWLVKWKDYGEDRNTWEPWSNLLASPVQAEAVQVREAALQPGTEQALQKFTMVTLKAVLAARGLETSGTKADLIARLLDVLTV